MEKLPRRFSPYVYALLRIIAGLMFAMHGSQKLFGAPGATHPVPIGTLFGLAGIIEFVCGVLIAVGLFTPFAALLASGEMAVAYFKQHAPAGALPILNHGELAVLYCFVFLYIAAQGSEAWSVDGIVRRRR